MLQSGNAGERTSQFEESLVTVMYLICPFWFLSSCIFVYVFKY
uniref:Uncharacterized protein n=1 Tax=Lepeophtheirus salmonis TaxID=72036 RepID=A0A0K2VDV3_LEPSM